MYYVYQNLQPFEYFFQKGRFFKVNQKSRIEIYLIFFFFSFAVSSNVTNYYLNFDLLCKNNEKKVQISSSKVPIRK